MKATELKKQLIEMIESIDDEELLYLLKEDFLFHAMSKEMPLTDMHISNAEDFPYVDAAARKSKLHIVSKELADKSLY